MSSDSIEDDSSGTETEDSSEDEYEDGFIDDSDLDMYPPSQVPNSGGSLTFLKDC
jgi:FK506-binding nuclear protein